MLRIGITGGIGSGKTTVCKVFELLGVSVYYADLEARRIMDFDDNIIDQIKKQFGSDIYEVNGLNRPKLASIVFENRSLLNELNKIVHPAVAIDFENWIKNQSQAPYILKEAAIIFESGMQNSFDKVITVSAPESLRINRVVIRDNSTVEEVSQRIQNQISDNERLRKSDFVIFCDDKHPVIEQVIKLNNTILNN